ncbi:hypothetical protein WOSG25_011960 [Weissella oryzae SG25]|uniref:FAD-dependent urate hydroxylase HpyO/Asp monooxygenase CreE-like FAD/NAD(P)-binding domain-containing protein n=1 Tax=Weissella oryzae (strain DSM 25784 / JCM 18191 / LMG 30913 / SG25) TaxID=1329250 RepID=A0A069CRR9_WEIOS|nr:FAD/NAD(P)-binding protein [Weissella oryzae]GAK30099.1 hypothetical protein WOSG25_011960 [Weissella oryzae SG25]
MEIALVGAGPRNLVLLESLIANAKTTTQPINVKIYDSAPIGGRVWQPNQNPIFLMNTVTQQLTLFTDDSVKHTTKNWLSGPNFYEWLIKYGRSYILAKNYQNTTAFLDEITQVSPNRFVSRALFGVYAEWFFEKIVQTAPKNLTIEHIKTNVIDIIETKAGFELTLANQTKVPASQVIMALGLVEQDLNPEEINFSQAAKSNDDLLYLPPTFPAEASLDQIPAKADVILRGLGLSFFDYMAKLSIGRKGRFVRADNGKLVYIPSGFEPHIIAGSRSGMPMHARGINQKNDSNSYQPAFFTQENLDELAHTNADHISFNQFFALLQKEIEFKHYQNVIADLAVTWPFNVTSFIEALTTSNDLNQTARAFDLPEEYILDWPNLLNPVASLTKEIDYNAAMLRYLIWTLRDASKGNVDAPYAGAFDILRDVRSTIRHVIEANYFTGDDYQQFLKVFNPWNSIISVGPPLLRTEQMIALIEAKVLTVTGPGLAVEVKDNAFIAHDNRGSYWTAKSLVEARLFSNGLAKASNPLVASLRDRGILSPASFANPNGQPFVLNTALMDRSSKQVINQDGEIIAGLYIWGVPTEGWDWFTTSAPRPNINDQNFQDAEAIAYNIFK